MRVSFIGVDGIEDSFPIFNMDGNKHPSLTIFIIAHSACAKMEKANIKFSLNSGKEKFIAEGSKIGRKEGYRKSEEKPQEHYASVIKQMKKEYPPFDWLQSRKVSVSARFRE